MVGKTTSERAMQKTIDLNAPTERVWAALTEADELMNWFPLEAKATSGVGGQIWFSWGEVFEGTATIEVWEPTHHLRTTWMEQPTENVERLPLVVDYFIETRGDGARLRLVHSGFGAGSDWDWLYDGVDAGWDFELRSLKRWLEAPPEQSRRLARVNRAVGDHGEAVWSRLFESGLARLSTAPDQLRAGDLYRLTICDVTLEGHVVRAQKQMISATVENMNDGLFYMCIESCGGAPMLVFWLATWGAPEMDVQRAQRAMEEAAERAAA